MFQMASGILSNIHTEVGNLYDHLSPEPNVISANIYHTYTIFSRNATQLREEGTFFCWETKSTSRAAPLWESEWPIQHLTHCTAGGAASITAIR